MSQHARPHLETHSRGAGHSAIAGVAYRLGLRLYDRRTDQWHDYRRRKLGEEVVRALTVAPEGAPAWAMDPQELWERVEAAEKRKDAQLARDYRIPLPFGLTDGQAGDLAEEMARFICRELHTSVSLGLHRDAEVDALGNVKPNEKQGFHAHIYFPTRRLEDIQQGEGRSSWGMGAKLILLSNKNTSGAFVERLNERWAELANRYTAKLGLPADYTHLSYVRQDLPVIPQPTLGAAVTAMERRGFFTRRGDALRGDILVPAKVYEAAHAVVVDAQRQQAIEDAVRERTNPAARAARLAAAASASPALPQPESVTAAPIVQAPLPKPPLTAPADSLVARFHAAAPAPATLEERQVFVRVMKIVGIVERVLAALAVLAARFRRHAEDQGRRMAAKLDTLCQLDAERAQRAAAKEKLERWETAHRWQVATARALGGGEAAKPKAWQALTAQFEACRRRVQTLKGTIRGHQVHLDAFAEEEAVLKAERVETHERLRSALATMVAVNQTAIEPLMIAAQGIEFEWLKAAMPDMAMAPEVIPQGEEFSEAVARLRPVARRLIGSP